MTFTTHNNHYKIGYDGVNNFQLRETQDQKHTVEFGRATRIGTFKEEAIKTARKIYEDADGQTIYISLSGGVDSEFIVHAFMAGNQRTVGADAGRVETGTTLDEVRRQAAHVVCACGRDAIDFARDRCRRADRPSGDQLGSPERHDRPGRGADGFRAGAERGQSGRRPDHLSLLMGRHQAGGRLPSTDSR